MTKNYTPKDSQFYYRGFYLFLLSLLLVACSADEEIPQDNTGNFVKELMSSSNAVYKGVFATQNSAFRGVFELQLPHSKGDLDVLNENARGILTLSSGAVYEARAIELRDKSSDFKVVFDSEDLSFTFTLDENDRPLITDVVFKEQSSSIIAAEETEISPVTPVTGTYRCTNCEDQNTSVNGIELNNTERTFNMLLTTEDGQTNLSIQAVVGFLVDTELVVNESCTTNEEYTFCFIKGGEGLTTEPLTWKGVQQYATEGSDAEDCSGISGIFEFLSSEHGSIQGEFKSDSKCPTTYFISPSGDDANTGVSPQDPWRSIGKVNSIDLQPGDIVLFEGGEEFEGSLLLNENDANDSDNPVRISSYGTGKATIKAGDNIGIYAYNTAGIIIDNFIVAGSGINSNQKSGIYFYNDLEGNKKLDLVRVTNCEVYGFREYGIVIGAWNGNSGYNDIIIENNKVHDILDVGISSYGQFNASKTGYAHSNLNVRNCEVYNIKGYSKKSHSGNGIVLADVQDSMIEHCTVYDSGSGNTSCGGPVGIWYWDADRVTIQYSEVYNMSSGSSNCDGGGFDMDGGVTNGLMQYNYSHNNDGAGYMVGQFSGARSMENITVRYNISENDAKTNGGSLYLFNGESSDSMKDIFFHNNTVYLNEKTRNSAPATIKYCLWKPVKENIHFNNNLLYASNGAALVDVPTGYDGNFAGNLYYSTDNFRILYKGNLYPSLEKFRITGREVYKDMPVGYEGEPLLQNPGNGGTIGFGNSIQNLDAYLLKSGSPAINGGILIPFEKGSSDYYGNTLSGSNFNSIGAHEEMENNPI